ncbi:MAG: T9SS type B sorting domain-containing protein, partial [Bacteroidetes bacterium]
IDPVTGELNATPNSVGTYVIGMCVQEYRNGILLGEVRRSIQVNVVNCQAPVALPDDLNEIIQGSFTNCTEFVEFTASSSAGFSVWWDFGDPTTTSDQSTLQSPTYTYPGPGVYDLTLVVYNPVNPNDPLCTDTTVQQVTIQPPVLPNAGNDTATCPGIPVQIGSPAQQGFTYSWSPITGLNNAAVAQPSANITQQTTYTLTAFDAVGCSGTDDVVVDLLLNADADAGPDVTICPGDSAQLGATGGVDFLWFPNIFINNSGVPNPWVYPPSTTDYIVGVTNADGCVGVDTVTVEVLVTELLVSDDAVICDGDTLQVFASGAVSYQWTPNYNISNVSSSTPNVYPEVTTTYIVVATDANNCVSTDSVTITVQPLPVANAGADTSICVGECVTLQASGGDTYSWSPATGLSDPSASDPESCLFASEEYVLVATDANGCSNTDTVVVTVNPLPNVNAGPDETLCLGESVQLQATGADTYDWSPSAGLSDTSIANPTAEPSVPTAYVVEGTDANGCASTDTVLVDVFVVDAIGDTIICIGDQAQLGAIGGVSWSWSPATGLSSTTAQFPTASPSTTTVYTVVADNGNECLATDSVLVVVSPLPQAFAGFDQGVCAGSNAQLNATGGVTYAWSPIAGLSNPNISNPVVTFASDTVTYTVTVTDAIGCSSTDEVTVWQEPLPIAVAGPDTTICIGESVQLTSSGGQTYQWSPAAGLSNTNVQNPIATPLTTTTYTVTVGQPTGNLVFNGDFSQGNVGFNSDYIYSNNLIPEGRYSVVTSASAVHPSFVGTGHTGNAPQDSFLVVNGAGTPNQNVWCQTVSVSPNTDYYFGAWVSTVVASSPAILQFSINGQVLGSPFSAPFNINNWVQFFQTWNSGNANTATICVVNQNTNTGGNDFAIDDITFSTFCTNTAEVTVTVNQLPQADAGPDQAICAGDVTQMQGSGGVSYQWVPPVGISEPFNPTSDASPNQTTTYTLIVQDNIGCEATDQVTLTVNPLPVANAGPNLSVCIGESVVLQGSGGVDYQWSPADYLDNPNAQLPISTPAETISYTLNVVDGNGCEDSDDVLVTVNPLPNVDAGVDSMICANGSLVLNASGATAYLWSPLVGISDPNVAAPTASPLVPTVYYVTGTDDNGCVNTDSVSITIFGVTAGPDSVICLNDSIQVFVSGGATFNWSPSDGVSDPNSQNPYVAPTSTTTYTVNVVSEFGCDASAEVTIGILTLPVSALTATFEPSCDGIYAQFRNESENAEDYLWLFGDGGSSTEFEPTHTYAPGPGAVVVLYTYNNDSLCSDSVLVDFSDQWFGNDTIDIKYATAFTPNYDGINDCFKPGFDGRFSDCYELKVYNRWGALIFESTAGQNHCWDGRTKGGKLCEEGTYFYMTSLKGYEKHGYVTLIY